MINRRNLIKLGAGTFVAGNVTATYAEEKNKDDTAVLFLFLGGGASHIETFNPIPLAPADRRSVTGAINTNVAGVEIGGLFTELAKRADKIAIPRAFGHRDQNHASAVQNSGSGQMIPNQIGDHPQISGNTYFTGLPGQRQPGRIRCIMGYRKRIHDQVLNFKPGTAVEMFQDRHPA